MNETTFLLLVIMLRTAAYMVVVSIVVVMFITYTKRDVNGGHCMSPGGLQAYSLPHPWPSRAPKVRRGGEGCASCREWSMDPEERTRRAAFKTTCPDREN